MKKLIALAVVFAGLAAFVYFYEIEGQEARDKAQQLEESLLRVQQDQISQVEIDRKDAAPIRLDRQDESWALEAPLKTAADKATVDTLLRGLADAHRERTFEDVKDEDLGNYGLDAPELTIRVTAGDRKETVLVGSKDFSGTSQYVMLEGSPTVYLTSTQLRSSADKPLLDWRDKSALKFDRDKVAEVEIRRPNDELHMIKKDDQWRLTQPIEDRGDETKISGLLSSLDSARADRFVDQPPESLSKYGLEKPAVIVRLREEGKDDWSELQLGAPDGDDYFARNPQRTAVFSLRKQVYDDLTQDAAHFRDLSVLDVQQDKISSLKIVRGEETLVLHHQDFKWTFESPEDLKGKEALSYKFWYPLSDMRFTDILKDVPQAERADVELVVTLSDGGERQYRYWKAGDTAYAQCVESGRGGRISNEDFEKLHFKTADIVLKDEQNSSE